VRECARVSPGSAGCFTYRLRSLLRYLAVRGVADPGLALAVPARWREATIPQFPTRPEIDGLLASCDLTGPPIEIVKLQALRLAARAPAAANHLSDAPETCKAQQSDNLSRSRSCSSSLPRGSQARGR
jgi:hypothetical protein